MKACLEWSSVEAWIDAEQWSGGTPQHWQAAKSSPISGIGGIGCGCWQLVESKLPVLRPRVSQHTLEHVGFMLHSFTAMFATRACGRRV